MCVCSADQENTKTTQILKFHPELLGDLVVRPNPSHVSHHMRQAIDMYEERFAGVSHDRHSLQHALKGTRPDQFAVVEIDQSQECRLFGMTCQDSAIHLMGSSLRKRFGDWRRTNHQKVPQRTLVARGAQLQRLAFDAEDIVCTDSVYHFGVGQFLKIETACFPIQWGGSDRALMGLSVDCSAVPSRPVLN